MGWYFETSTYRVAYWEAEKEIYYLA